MNTTNIKDIDVREILPQREPFLMISRLVEYSPEKTISEFEIKEDNIFIDSVGHFAAEGLTENIAQTCAAKVGYHGKFILGGDVKIGFIGAIKNLVFHSLPSVGDTISTEVETVQEIFNVTMVSAKVYGAGGSVLAEGTMKIALEADK